MNQGRDNPVGVERKIGRVVMLEPRQVDEAALIIEALFMETVSDFLRATGQSGMIELEHGGPRESGGTDPFDDPHLGLEIGLAKACR